MPKVMLLKLFLPTWHGRMLLLALLLMTSCSEKASQPVQPSEPLKIVLPQPAPALAEDASIRWFRLMAISKDNVLVPFFMALDPAASTVRFDNGDEQLTHQAIIGASSIDVQFPITGSKMHLEIDGLRVTGTWHNVLNGDLNVNLKIEGRQIPVPAAHILFPGEWPTKGVDVSGTWRVELGSYGAGVAIIRQLDEGEIRGSVVVPGLGDSGALTGRLTGTRFRMSQFDGTHALLFSAHVSEDGDTFEGKLVFPGFGVFPATGTRSAPVDVSTILENSLREGATSILIPELEARQDLVGKPVIVDLFGTWCSACRALTPTLVDLHNRYASQGLEVIGVAIEPDDDAKAAAQRVDALSAHYSIPWPISLRLVHDVSTAMPQEIVGHSGFPVTIFFRRDHSVAAIHSSFLSPAAGEAHFRLIGQFDAWTREILNSPPPKHPLP